MLVPVKDPDPTTFSMSRLPAYHAVLDLCRGHVRLLLGSSCEQGVQLLAPGVNMSHKLTQAMSSISHTASYVPP